MSSTRKSPAHVSAAKLAWKTIRKNHTKAQLHTIYHKAALKAWKTIRANRKAHKGARKNAK